MTKLRALILLLPLLLTACYEAKQAWVLNPDGSGKVTMDLVFQTLAFGAEGKDPQKKLMSAVKDLVTKSKGVDAWSEIKFSLADDGRIRFSGTAYFPDLAKLDLQQGNMLGFSMAAGDKGTLVLQVKGDTKKGAKKAAEPAGPLTPEEKAKKIAKAKGEFQQGRGMIAAFLATLRHEATLELPGSVKQSMNLRRLDSGKLAITLDGKKLLEAIDSLANDEAFFERQVTQGPSSDLMGDELLNVKLFGEKGPVRAVLAGPFAPRFDYAAAVTAAKAGEPALRSSLGLGEAPAPAAPGAGVTAKVAGVQAALEADNDNRYAPFQQWNPQYQVCVAVDFGGAILEITSAVLEKADTDDGKSILAEEEYERKASFPRLTKDGRKALCEFKLKPPAAAARGLSRLEGKVSYLSSDKFASVDTGLPALRPGAKGQAHGVEVKGIKPCSWDKELTDFEFTVKLPSARIKEVQLLDAEGKAAELERGSESGGEDETTFTYRVKGKVPEKGKLVLVVWQEVKTFEAGFTIEQVDFLGRSLK